MAIINTLTKVSSLFSDITDVKDAYMFNEVKAQQELPCRVASAVTASRSTQVTLGVKLDVAGPLTIETCDDVFKRHQTMIACGIMDVMQGGPFDVNVANLSADPLHLPKQMLAQYAAASQKGIVHPRGVEPDTMKHSEENGAFISRTGSTAPNSVAEQSTDMLEAENDIHAGYHKPTEHLEDQIH